MQPSRDVFAPRRGRFGDDRLLEFPQRGRQVFLPMVPYGNGLGLDWLIIIVSPTTAFFAQIDSLQTAFWVCFAVTILIVILGIVISNWLPKPMLHLGQAQLSESGQATESLSNPGKKAIERAQLQGFETQQSQTAQLQQALKFEHLLRQITGKVRASLDESHILQTTVQELGLALGVQGCHIALFDLEQGTTTLGYEYLCTNLASAQCRAIDFKNLPELYPQLLQRHTQQFCLLKLSLDLVPDEQTELSCLTCPLMDAQGVIGELQLFKPKQHYFNWQEICLVEQVAGQCAIALRQSRLYQTAQTQILELERLHQVKDDFLSTVSHELRTPMANIEMATQLLEMSLERLGLLNTTTEPICRYLQILKDEGHREMLLINDLLDLSRLDAGTEPYMPTTIDPNIWIPHIVEPFHQRTQMQQQQLQLDLAPNLPSFTTDLAHLERILSELLNNACKYTPAGEKIIVSAHITNSGLPNREAAEHNTFSCPMRTSLRFRAAAPSLLLSVINSGIEIPEQERERIFDKFYRIPSHDPWQQGGTGLGLALAKGLVERLAGKISVESGSGLTTFTVQLPLEVY